MHHHHFYLLQRMIYRLQRRSSLLFLTVKASRPMTYQYLKVQMVESIGENGIINQTIFKKKKKSMALIR